MMQYGRLGGPGWSMFVSVIIAVLSCGNYGLGAVMRWCILALLAVLTACATPQPLSRRDVALEASWLAIHLVDYGQTRTVARNPDRYYECNPCYGEHPSVNRIDVLFPLGAVLHPVVTWLLPPRWRPYWQGASIASSGGCVVNNQQNGIRPEF